MAEKKEKVEATTPQEIQRIEEERENRRWFWRMIRENAQDILILVSIILGLRPHPQQGEKLPSGKEVPNWFLSAFPSFTDEDEIEYNLIRDSHSNPEARKAEAEFCCKLAADGYDEIKYRVRLVKLRREYVEQLRNPAPPDKSGGRLAFTPLVLRDSVTEFISELIAETQVAGTPEEIYERQKKIALYRKLLAKKHFFKKCWENKLVTLLVILSVVACVPCLLFWIFCLFLG